MKLSQETVKSLRKTIASLYREPVDTFNDNVEQVEILEKLNEAYLLMKKYNNKR